MKSGALVKCVYLSVRAHMSVCIIRKVEDIAQWDYCGLEIGKLYKGHSCPNHDYSGYVNNQTQLPFGS